MAPVAGNKRPRESDVNHTAAKKPKESVPDNDETLKDMHLEHSDAEAAKQSTSDAAPVVADDAVDDANPADAQPCVPTNNTPSPFALRPVNSNEPNIDDSQPENDDPSSPPQQVPTAGSMLPPPVIPGKSRGRGSDSTTSAAIAAVQASQAAAAAAAAAASAPTAPIDASSNPYLARYGEGQHPPPPPPGYIPMPFMPHHNPYLANQFPMYIPHTGHMMPIPIPFDQSQYRPPAGATPQGAATTQSGEGNTEAGQSTENTEGNNNENGNGAAASNAEGGTSTQQPPPIPHPFPHPPPGFPHHPFPTHMPPPEFLPNPNDPHNPHTHPHHTHLLPPMHHPHAPNTMQLTLPLAVADHALPSHLDALIRAPESLTITYSEVPDGAYLLRSDFGEPYPKQLEPPRKTTEMRCLFCKRHYSGPNARGMWRRHVTGKHDFVFERKGKDSLPGIVPRRGNVGEHDDDDDPPSPTGNGTNGDTPNPGQSNPTVTPGAPGAPGMGLVGPDGVMGLMSLNGMPIHATSGQPNPPGTPGTPGHPPPPPPHMMEERIERARASKRHYAMKRRALEKMKQGGIPKGARLVDGVFILADGTQIPAEPGRVYTDLNAPSASTGVHLAGTGSSGVVGDDGDDDDYGKKKKRRLSRRSSSKRRGKDDEDEDEDEEADELAVGEELQEGLISMEGGDADHWNMASNPSQAQGSGSVSVTDQSVQVGMSTTTTSVITQTPGSGKLAEVPIISRGFKPPPMTPHVMTPQQSPTAPVTVQTATTATATTTTTVVKRGGAVSGTTGRARGGRRKSAARIDDEMDADDQPPAASTEATGTDAQTANVEEGKGDASKDQAQEQSTEDAEPSVPTTTTTTRSGRTVKSSIQSTTPKRTTTRGGRGAKKDDSTAEDKEQDNKDKPTTTSNLPPGIIPPGEDDEEDERRFCYCGDVEYGQMIGCDNGPNCPREWVCFFFFSECETCD
ncbi:hypothetical protein FRC03_007036 [Tulasnella sp. 419]|nr:hypothetical protein FRC03_007036 [Tulasnella sp. 419]